MKKSFTIDETIYMETEKGYFYKSTGAVDKKGNPIMMRIAKHIFEQAFDKYIQIGHDQGDVEDEWDIEDEIVERKEVEDQRDRETEQNFNKKTDKKAAKPRKSKDIAYEGNGVTLTAKQVKFISRMPEDYFYENGLDSTLWIDVFCDTVADEFSPMAVGAMISTLKEKNLISVSKERVNGRVSKYFAFTELGTKVAKELGLK